MEVNFSTRAGITEIMDDLQCSGEVVDQTLRELEIINKWLGGNGVTVSGIGKILKGSKPPRPLEITDLGCGGGDILKEIAIWGRRKKLLLKLTGVDANPHIVSFAKENCADFKEIHFLEQDVFSEKFKQGAFDIAIATLFAHHFSTRELVQLFQSLKDQCRMGFVINDLHRHWFAFHSIRLLTKWFSKSPMVKFDAPVSVLRSFTRPEIESILAQAGITNYSLSWKWAFRWQLVVPSNLA